MLGAQIHTRRHCRKHHRIKTKVVVVKHPLGLKDIINSLMQLVPHVDKKEITLVFNIELDGLLESQRLSV